MKISSEPTGFQELGNPVEYISNEEIFPNTSVLAVRLIISDLLINLLEQISDENLKLCYFKH